MVKLWELLVADLDMIPESPPPDTPHAGLAHSKMCFDTLIRLYYLRHGFEGADLTLPTYLVALSSMSAAKLKTLTFSAASSSAAVDDVRSTLILSTKGLHDQRQNYSVCQTLRHLIEQQMSSKDIELMWKFLHESKEASEAQHLRASHLQSQAPVYIVKITEDPKNEHLSNWIKLYADLSLESTSQVESSDTRSSPGVSQRDYQ